MSNVKLYQHQVDALKSTADLNKVAYYLDMGLGKTYVGSVKMEQLALKANLLICQCSKIKDWMEHFRNNHPTYKVFNLRNEKELNLFLNATEKSVGVINYELAFRRKSLTELNEFTLMLDESSIIQNEMTKQAKFILKLSPTNVILLSGSPSSGKYELLWSQLKLLGWKISKDLFWKQYVDVEYLDVGGFPVKTVRGYKNVDRLKNKLAEYGAVFMKSEEVFDLPDQVPQYIEIPVTKEYRRFMKDCIVTVEDIELVGDSTLNKRLYARQLCGQYNEDKLQAFADVLASTEDRLIVFYNFNEELKRMIEVVGNRPCSIVNGTTKDLTNYETQSNSVTFVQYQAGAMGLNLQKANKIIYFTLTQSCSAWMQSKKRTHRIGQTKTCFYYYLMCENSVEFDILRALEQGRDYNDELFKKYEESV